MSTRRILRIRPAVWAGLVLVFTVVSGMTGCGGRKNPPKANVSGKVTLGGKPVGGGIVVFTLADNPNVTGTAYIRKDGTYEVKNTVPIGTCKVTVTTSHLNPNQPPQKPGDPPRYSPDHYVQLSGDAKTGKAYTAIPAKYEKIDTTPLTVDIKEGDNPYDITLDAK